MGGGGGLTGESGGGMGPGGGAPAIVFRVMWMSAMPIKIAQVRSRLGAEAETSEQAKKYLATPETHYVIAVAGGMPMRSMGGPSGGDRKQGPMTFPPDVIAKIKESTILTWKGHEGLHPDQITAPKEGQTAWIYSFPKTHPIELEDKEVEFFTKRGPMEIRKKFKLKEMVYKGELAL
jgi:hypothetical protein